MGPAPEEAGQIVASRPGSPASLLPRSGPGPACSAPLLFLPVNRDLNKLCLDRAPMHRRVDLDAENLVVQNLGHLKVSQLTHCDGIQRLGQELVEGLGGDDSDLVHVRSHASFSFGDSSPSLTNSELTSSPGLIGMILTFGSFFARLCANFIPGSSPSARTNTVSYPRNGSVKWSFQVSTPATPTAGIPLIVAEIASISPSVMAMVSSLSLNARVLNSRGGSPGDDRYLPCVGCSHPG